MLIGRKYLNFDRPGRLQMSNFEIAFSNASLTVFDFLDQASGEFDDFRDAGIAFTLVHAAEHVLGRAIDVSMLVVFVQDDQSTDIRLPARSRDCRTPFKAAWFFQCVSIKSAAADNSAMSPPCSAGSIRSVESGSSSRLSVEFK